MKVVNKNYEVHDVNIMRPSEWGNPFSHLGYGTGLNRVKTREEAVARFAELFYSEQYRDRRRRLLSFPANLRLGCCCKPKACHGDIIAGYFNWKMNELLIESATEMVNKIFRADSNWLKEMAAAEIDSLSEKS